MDFVLLPPEVNSGLMYAGPGLARCNAERWFDTGRGGNASGRGYGGEGEDCRNDDLCG